MAWLLPYVKVAVGVVVTGLIVYMGYILSTLLLTFLRSFLEHAAQWLETMKEDA